MNDDYHPEFIELMKNANVLFHDKPVKIVAETAGTIICNAIVFIPEKERHSILIQIMFQIEMQIKFIHETEEYKKELAKKKKVND